MGFEVTDTQTKETARKALRKKPKEPYQHPENASLIWDGTGRRPQWVRDLTKSGWNLEDLRVTQPPVEKPREEEAAVEAKPEQEQAAEVTEEPLSEPEEQKTGLEWPL
jgi:hypothetical protein